MKKIINRTIPFLIILGLTASCSKEQSKQVSPPRPVHIANAISLTVPIYVESFGYLTAKKSVNVTSQVTGKILSCHFHQGQHVNKGDLLFTVDDRIYKSELAQAEAELRQDTADLDMKKMVVHKDRKLEVHGAIAHQDYFQLLTDLEKLKAQIGYDNAMIANSKIMLEYCSIRSPINGITGVRKVDPGNIVVANNGPTLVNIKTVNTLYLDFTIPEKNLMRLQDSMQKSHLKVMIFVDEYGIKKSIEGNVYTGTLEFFDNSIDHETGTIFLRASIPNSKRELWPGQFVRLMLILDNIPNATLVPYQAVSRGLEGSYVFTIDKNNKAILHYVKVGQKEGSYIVINSDTIKPGDKVVVVGQMGLAPNVKVNVVGKENFPTPNFSKVRKTKYSKVEKMASKLDKQKYLNKNILKNKKLPETDNQQ